jgi:translation elongation factor EF-G
VQKKTFKGVVDLINNRGIVWNEADKGMTFTEVPIPDDMLEDVAEWRGKLLEAIAEFDDIIDGKILRRSKFNHRSRSFSSIASSMY